MKEGVSGTEAHEIKWDDVTANPQPTAADKPPIPEPPTDGFPIGEEDLTSRVPGDFLDVARKSAGSTGETLGV